MYPRWRGVGEGILESWGNGVLMGIVLVGRSIEIHMKKEG